MPIYCERCIKPGQTGEDVKLKPGLHLCDRCGLSSKKIIGFNNNQEVEFLEDINFYDEFDKLCFVRKNPKNISLINNPSDQLKLMAIQYSVESIKFIKNPSEKEIDYALRTWNYSVACVKSINPKLFTVWMKRDIIRKDPENIKYIGELTKEDIQYYFDIWIKNSPWVRYFIETVGFDELITLLKTENVKDIIE
jgi:hypothetical protein